MAHDEDEGDDGSHAGAPLPPEDRVWRHPSEIGGGAAPPAAWIAPAPSRRRPALALAGACLTGAAITCGLLWLTRPSWVSEEPTATQRPRTAVATTASVAFAPAGVPTAQLADALAPHLVAVEVKRGDAWTTGSGLRLADADRILVVSPLVQGATAITVSVGRRTVDATVLGDDGATGATVLELSTAGAAAPPGPLLASSARAGQAVAVVGTRTTTAGGDDRQRVVPASVSTAGARAAIGDLVLHDAIELDRSLPDDALGAAVVDASGHLLGVVIDVSGSGGLAVVVPGRATLTAAADLLDDGEVRRAWLGVEAADLDPEVATLLQVDGGAMVTAVDQRSPAAEAGVQPGDVITEVGDLDVRDASDLVVAIRAGRPGEQVEMCWRRGADEQRAEVTLGG